MQPTLIRQQNGYGAFKRGERCESCIALGTTGSGTYRVEYPDGSVRFFCGDHINAAFETSQPPTEPA